MAERLKKSKINGESQKISMCVKTRLHQLVEDGIYTGGLLLSDISCSKAVWLISEERNL